MPVEILLAFASLIGGIASAVFAWWQAVKTTRMNASVTEQVERLRTDATRRREALSLATAEAAPVEAALDQVWRDVQEAKDCITAILADIDAAVATQSLKSVSDRIVGGYREWGSRLPPDARSTWHALKGDCSLAVNLIQNQGNSTADFHARLNEIRLALTDRQLILANERALLRQQLADRALSLL